MHFVNGRAIMYKLTPIRNSKTEYPGVAQLVAHLTGGQGVVSSSLATRTSKSPETAMVSGLLFFALSPGFYHEHNTNIMAIKLFGEIRVDFLK